MLPQIFYITLNLSFKNIYETKKKFDKNIYIYILHRLCVLIRRCKIEIKSIKTK